MLFKMKNVFATIAGLIDAFLIVLAFDFLAHILFPMETDFNSMNMEDIIANLDKIPNEQFYLMGLGHLLAIGAGMGLASLISKTSKVPAIIVGSLISLFTIINLFSFPHPTLFLVVDLAAIILGIYLGLYFTKKLINSN